MKRVAIIATAILSAIALNALGQSPRETPSSSAVPTVQISGRVLADGTGDPIANARVSLLGGAHARVSLTDGDGRFAFSVPSGRYSISAKKSRYGRADLAVVDPAQPVALRLPRAAVISGRVVNEFGDPVVWARVSVQRAVATTPGQYTSVAAADTDDRGEFRVGNLEAGTFVVGLSTQGRLAQTVVGATTIISPAIARLYYPDATTTSEAETLHLEPGEERSSIDFVVPAAQSGFGPSLARDFMPSDEPEAIPGNTGVIRGRVASTDGRGLPHATVRIVERQVSYRPRLATADADGHFEFRDLPKGSFFVTAEKVGYSTSGETTPFGMVLPTSGTPVDLSDGETRERLDITLSRWGSLDGRVLDELGDPIEGVSVQLMQVRYQGGRRQLVGAGGAPRLTDDLGHFRLYAMPPGQYIVSAAVGDVASNDVPGYTRSYFPGTASASEAQFVSVGLSQDIAGIDLVLVREKTALVAGTLLDANGVPKTGGSLKLIPSRRSNAISSLDVGARITPDGKFEFPNVPPGQYVIQADRGRRGSSMEGEFGMLAVSVNGVDVTDLTLQTTVGSSIAGRITFVSSRGTSIPRPQQIEIVPVPTDADQSPPSVASAEISADWRFEVKGVHGPRRLQLQRAPAEWTLQEIRIGGIDVTDRVLAFGRSDQSRADVEFVLTDRVNDVTGSILDMLGRPITGSHLVMFSTDRDRWYPASRFLRESAAGIDGSASIKGMPPGSYYAAAVARLPPDGDDAWQDPAFLESLMPWASTVVLGDGQSQLIKLAVGGK